MVLGTHDLIAVVSELHSQGAKVCQEAHDQAPLDPGCIHMDILGHEDEIWGAGVKEGHNHISLPITGQANSKVTGLAESWYYYVLLDYVELCAMLGILLRVFTGNTHSDPTITESQEAGQVGSLPEVTHTGMNWWIYTNSLAMHD